MRIEWNRRGKTGTAVFKSSSKFWGKESDGSKNYTVRQIPEESEEWEDFEYWMEYCPHKRIRIEGAGGPEMFTRDVKDITILGFFLGNHIVGISWRHPE